MFSRPLKVALAMGSVAVLFAAVLAVNARLSWRPVVVKFPLTSSAPQHVPIAWNGEELWLLTSPNDATYSSRALHFSARKTVTNWNRSFIPIIAPTSSRADMIALSPQKNIFVLSHADNRVELWKNGLRTRVLEQRPDLPNVLLNRACPVMISPDGRLVVVGSRYSESHGAADNYPGNMTVFDLSNGRAIARYRNTTRGGLCDFAWSPDSQEVAGITANGWVFVLSVKTGKVRLTFRAHRLWGAQIAWSPDGKTLVTGSNARFGVAPIPFCVDLGGDNSTCLGLKLGTTTMKCGNTGKDVLAGRIDRDMTWNGRTERLLKRFDARTGKPIGSPFPLETGAVDMAFSPDGQQLALGEHGFALLLNTDTLATERRLTLEPSLPVCVAWSLGGDTLATSTMSRLTLWRTR